MKESTNNFLHWEQQYQIKAREALPILVKFAENATTITYSELAEIIDMSNPRNLWNVLWAIWNMLEDFKGVPPIQCIVIRKDSLKPGDWVNPFLNWLTLDESQRAVFEFQNWKWILKTLWLEEVNIDIPVKKYQEKIRKWGYGWGESENHRKMKEKVSKNPSIININNVINTDVEYSFLSADKIDILFETPDEYIWVEIKSSLSDTPDILRGILQAVKYKALLEAHIKIYKMDNKWVRAILVIEGTFPQELKFIQKLLWVNVMDNIF